MDFSKLDFNKVAPIISIVSVVVMFLWGMLGNDWGHSWIAVFIGGAIISILKIVTGNNQKGGDK